MFKKVLKDKWNKTDVSPEDRLKGFEEELTLFMSGHRMTDVVRF